VGTTDAESAAVESAAAVESTATMTAAAMTAAAVTTPTGSHVVRWDETQRQDCEEGAEDFGSSCHDSLRFKLPDAVRN
jgi:hypothetical protein